MTSPEPIPTDAVIQLTRIEGKIDLIFFQVTDHAKILDRHGEDITQLKMTTQQLSSDAGAREDTVVATAKALADAKKAQDDAVESKWAPWGRTTAIVVAAVAVAQWLSPFIGR